MVCKKCGKNIPVDAVVCPYCGAKTTAEKSKTKIYRVSSKNRAIAGLLCLLGFIGLAGIHRMYVGKWKTGLLYALTFSVFFMGTLYDLFSIFSESFTDTDGFPLYAQSSMKSNYKERDPKGETNIIIKVLAVFFLLISFINLMAVLTVGTHKTSNQANVQTGQTTQKDNNKDNKEDDKKTDEKKQKKEKKSKKRDNEPSELQLVEKVKENYQNNNFIDARNTLIYLKRSYPESQYIGALETDYPDLIEKADAEQQESDRRHKEALDAFNAEMSNFSIYEGYAVTQGGIKFCVFVNSHWYSLSKGEKETFTEMAYTTFDKYGLHYPNFYIVNVRTQRNLAHYPGIFGGVALDE